MKVLHQWVKLMEYCLAAGSILFLGVTAEDVRYFWKESDSWSSCSVTCGKGTSMKEIFCAIQIKDTFVKAQKYECLNVSEPTVNVVPCYNSKCPSSYEWKIYPWSLCTQPCGNLGYQTRDVDCFETNVGSNELAVDEAFCDKLNKPLTKSVCNRLDCKASFVTDRWGKCRSGSKCKPGKQVRELKCVKILANGAVKYVSIAECNKQVSQPPQKWRKCFDYVNNEGCDKKIVRKKVKFKVVDTNLYQMRQAKVVRLEIGQIGYILPYARVTVACSVQNFPLHEIKWKHKNVTIKYGKKISTRIRVNKFGELRIRKLQFEDQGEWKCMAGEYHKSAIIKIRNPSSGFRDWAIRSNLWKTRMLSEESEGAKNSEQVLQWVKSRWSICSVTCSGDGSQYREVQCERVKLKSYEILDDSQCEEILKTYPAKVRTCHNSLRCPEWHYNSSNVKKCSTDCINIGMATKELDLKCLYLDQEVPLHMCDTEKKPESECKNDICQLDWRLSPWSKCSKSCGGVGFQARHVTCVWTHSRKSAKSLCYDTKFPTPTVVRKCFTKKCTMGCFDIATMCSASGSKCYYGLYRHLCCLTCQNYFKKLSKDDD